MRLLTIIRHFIDEDLKLYIITLAFKELKKKNLKINQDAIILDVLDNFEMRNKLRYLIMNNVDINNIFIEHIVDVLQ